MSNGQEGGWYGDVATVDEVRRPENYSYFQVVLVALVECTVRPTWRQSDRSGTESGTSPPALYTDRTPPTTHPTHAFPLPSTFARSLPLPPLPRTQDLSPKNDTGSDVTTGSDSPIRVGASVGGGDPGESLPVVTSLPVSFLGARTTNYMHKGRTFAQISWCFNVLTNLKKEPQGHD